MWQEVSPGLRDEEYWSWLLESEGISDAPTGKRPREIGGGEMFRGLSEKYGKRLGSRVVWVYFEYHAEIVLWQEYARLRDALYRDKVLIKPHKGKGGLVLGHRRVTDSRSLGLDEAYYEVVVNAPDCVEKVRVGKDRVKLIDCERGRVVRASVAQIEQLGKGIGLKIQDAWRGRGMRRKWTCGCEEFRNRRGDSVLTSDCGDERGCEVRNYYRFQVVHDVNVTYL